MLKSLKLITAALALGLSSLPASAVETFTFSNEFSGSGDTCALTSCATLTVEQNGSNVDFVLTGNLASGEFIEGLYGNQDPFDLTVGAFSGFTGTGSDAFVDVQVGEDAFKADGDGDFDWLISFRTSPPRFDGVDTLSWTIADTSLASIIDATSQGGPDGKTGFTFALKVQGLGPNNEGSGWFSSTPDDDVPEGQIPEPGSLLLLGLGLAGLALTQRRRRRV